MRFLKRLLFQIWYLRKPPWDTNQAPPELFEFMGAHSPGRALDLGCGTGTNAITLAEHGWQAVGVDFVPKAIRAARKKAEKAGVNVEFHVDDVTRLTGIEGPFDLLLDIGCYHSLDFAGMKRYREQVRRLLAPGGIYLVYLFFRSAESSSWLSGSNVTESDLEPFLDFMQLVNRDKGNERGMFRSDWITYRRKAG
jgi:SAM-dependent methyltransferase